MQGPPVQCTYIAVYNFKKTKFALLSQKLEIKICLLLKLQTTSKIISYLFAFYE